jgi:hypothetical protein
MGRIPGGGGISSAAAIISASARRPEPPLRRELAHEVERLAALAYTAFAPAENDGALAAGLLAAHYTCLQY